MIRKTLALLRMCILLGFTANSFAAEITLCNPLGRDSQSWICVNGNIEAGDYNKINDLLERKYTQTDNSDGGTSTVKTLAGIYIESLGGDVQEAINIGRLTRRLYWSVRAKDCASACLLVLAGGVSIHPDNYLHENTIEDYKNNTVRRTQLGFHRPRFADIRAFSELSPDVASKRYKKILVEIESYLNEMEASNEFIALMFSASSDAIEWIAFDDALDKGILAEKPMSIDEWVRANCDPLTEEEKVDLRLLGYQRNETPLYPEEAQRVSALSPAYIDYVEKKSNKYSRCHRNLRIKTQRKALIAFSD